MGILFVSKIDEKQGVIREKIENYSREKRFVDLMFASFDSRFICEVTMAQHHFDERATSKLGEKYLWL